MASQAKIDPKGGSLFWNISVSQLKLGVYRGLIYDKSNTVLQKWDDQRTDDSVPDRFQISAPPNQLIGGTLWWQSLISDPSDIGGPYVCKLSIEQDGKILCKDTVPGNVGVGSGQMDPIGDQISFV
jgi:hypothetical protein